ncbi:hypothetical protein AKO1_006449 [Acrasis kona]|uniref:Uncharacterized protein n=1 Tax=Acrasis kona TaxID=1008807 RepID=A0AAW2Z9L5_9EUKA
MRDTIENESIHSDVQSVLAYRIYRREDITACKKQLIDMIRRMRTFADVLDQCQHAITNGLKKFTKRFNINFVVYVQCTSTMSSSC